MLRFDIYFLIGNHTIRGCESYRLLQSLSDIIGEINTLATSKSSTVDGLKIDAVFGGDYKVYLSTYIVHTCIH